MLDARITRPWSRSSPAQNDVAVVSDRDKTSKQAVIRGHGGCDRHRAVDPSLALSKSWMEPTSMTLKVACPHHMGCACVRHLLC